MRYCARDFRGGQVFEQTGRGGPVTDFVHAGGFDDGHQVTWLKPCTRIGDPFQDFRMTIQQRQCLPIGNVQFTIEWTYGQSAYKTLHRRLSIAGLTSHPNELAVALYPIRLIIDGVDQDGLA